MMSHARPKGAHLPHESGSLRPISIELVLGDEVSTLSHSLRSFSKRTSCPDLLQLMLKSFFLFEDPSKSFLDRSNESVICETQPTISECGWQVGTTVITEPSSPRMNDSFVAGRLHFGYAQVIHSSCLASSPITASIAAWILLESVKTFSHSSHVRVLNEGKIGNR